MFEAKTREQDPASSSSSSSKSRSATNTRGGGGDDDDEYDAESDYFMLPSADASGGPDRGVQITMRRRISNDRC